MIALRGKIEIVVKESIAQKEAFRCVISYPVDIEANFSSSMNILGSLTREMKRKFYHM